MGNLQVQKNLLALRIQRNTILYDHPAAVRRQQAAAVFSGRSIHLECGESKHRTGDATAGLADVPAVTQRVLQAAQRVDVINAASGELSSEQPQRLDTMGVMASCGAASSAQRSALP